MTPTEYSLVNLILFKMPIIMDVSNYKIGFPPWPRGDLRCFLAGSDDNISIIITNGSETGSIYLEMEVLGINLDENTPVLLIGRTIRAEGDFYIPSLIQDCSKEIPLMECIPLELTLKEKPIPSALIEEATCQGCGNLMEVDSDKVVGYYCPNCRPELQPSARQEFIDNNDAATIDAFSVGGG
jgi:hypothetical protein